MIQSSWQVNIERHEQLVRPATRQGTGSYAFGLKPDTTSAALYVGDVIIG